MPPVTLDHHHCTEHEAGRAGSPPKNDRYVFQGIAKHVVTASDQFNLQAAGLSGLNGRFIHVQT